MKPNWRRLRISVKPIKIKIGDSTNSCKSGTCFPRVKIHLVKFAQGTLVVVFMWGKTVVAFESAAVRSVTSEALGAAVAMVVFTAVMVLEAVAVSDGGVSVLPMDGVVMSATVVVLTAEESLEVCTTLTFPDPKKVMKLLTVALVVVGNP